MATTDRNQSIIDITIQTTGALEALFDVAELHDLRIDEKPRLGTVIQDPPAELIDRRSLQNINNDDLKPASVDDPGLGEGIDYWAIEHDFIVS